MVTPKKNMVTPLKHSGYIVQVFGYLYFSDEFLR